MFTFCKPVSSRKRFLPHRQISKDFTFSLFDHIIHVNAEHWDSITHKRTVFLERSYLAILEHGHQTRIACRYVIVYHHRKPCGIIYFQVVDFKAGVFGEMISRQVENIRNTRMSLFEKYVDANKDEVLLRLCTCGNNLVSGEHGFLFSETVKKDDAHTILLKIVDLIAHEEKLSGTISAILLKDFHRPLFSKKTLTTEKYSEFEGEPNMVVAIPPGISALNDYVDRFSKKYRNRAKAIFRKMEGVSVKELGLAEIKKREKDIYRLYEEVFSRAKFRLVKLPSHYFSHVKEAFADRFTIIAYFKDDALMAFTSTFMMPDNTLEAHYIGVSYEMNGTYELYQNILYSFIKQGIEKGCGKVNLGRTAAEIKTTVGARPEPLICYIKPQNTISKIIQKPFVSFMQPAEWTPRNPFKEEL